MEEQRRTELIQISDDKMDVYLTIYKKENESHSVDDLMQLLSSNKIVYGIKTTVIEKMVQNEEYYKDKQIAEGIPPVQGKEGYFEFLFDTQPNKKPIILEDGSVDYNTLGKIELCKENDLLAIYHPAQSGADGINVYGITVPSARIHELKPLKGKGFTISEDGTQYFAAKDGKVEYKDGKLNVMELYVVEGDVDAATGDIKFNGDILVKGSVYSNVKIEAKGSITVNGHVEMASLTAGKDVILRNGMQGAGKGFIFSKGSVSAKFFEQTVVIAAGNINANTIMNCDMESDRQIVVSGKRGVIIGGKSKAIEKIEASVIGNRAEIATLLVLGLDVDFKEEMLNIHAVLDSLQEQLDEVNEKLNRIMQKLSKHSVTLLQDARNELLRNKIELDTKFKVELKRKDTLLDRKERSADSNIVVQETLFPNTTIYINGASQVFKGLCKDVTIKKKEGEIHIYANH